MGGCTSNCSKYTNNIADLNLSCNGLDPQPLTLHIVRRNNGSTHDVTFIAPDGSSSTFTFSIVGSYKILHGAPGLTITIYDSILQVAEVTFGDVEGLSKSSYISGDKYIITTESLGCPTSIGPDAKFSFERPKKGTIRLILGSSTNVCVNCQSFSNTAETIPRIQIEAQSSINATDIGDAIFTIYDEFTYYDRHRIPDNVCKLRQSINIKETIFKKCCPYIVSVVKGKGITLFDKLQYLYESDKSVSFNDFYANIALYAMAKYILARVLYSTFNIKYLLRKYNERFLRDLSNSRFCAFKEFFDANDYTQYFLYDIKK